MVDCLPSKQKIWVRFPLSACIRNSFGGIGIHGRLKPCAQWAAGSNPATSIIQYHYTLQKNIHTMGTRIYARLKAMRKHHAVLWPHKRLSPKQTMALSKPQRQGTRVSNHAYQLRAYQTLRILYGYMSKKHLQAVYAKAKATQGRRRATTDYLKTIGHDDHNGSRTGNDQ